MVCSSGMLLPESCRWKSDRPVCSMARLGMQIAPWVPQGMWAWVNVVPRATRRSMFGVEMALLPSAWMVSKRWSSVKNSRTLDGLARDMRV